MASVHLSASVPSESEPVWEKAGLPKPPRGGNHMDRLRSDVKTCPGSLSGVSPQQAAPAHALGDGSPRIKSQLLPSTRPAHPSPDATTREKQ